MELDSAGAGTGNINILCVKYQCAQYKLNLQLVSFFLASPGEDLLHPRVLSPDPQLHLPCPLLIDFSFPHELLKSSLYFTFVV